LNCRFWRVVKWPKPPRSASAWPAQSARLVVFAGDARQHPQLALDSSP
jgi:hypothetical protein